MEDVVLLRRFETPVTLDDLMARFERFKWCFEVHRAGHRQSYVSLDGLNALCLFEAPEAEALRTAMREIDSRSFEVWPVTVHRATAGSAARDADTPPAAAQDAASLVVVERRFEAPMTFEDLQAMEERGAWCLDLYRVRFLATYFSRDRRRMFCTYRAPDAESVRNAQGQIGMPFERAWSAVAYAAEPSAAA